MDKKALTKADRDKILNSYSLRKNEFTEYSSEGYTYKSHILNQGGITYLITIKVVDDDGNNKTIHVTHSDNRGRRTFIDVWTKLKDGTLEWLCRNPVNVPLSDIEVIHDLKAQLAALNERFNKQGAELQKLIEIKVGRPSETGKQVKSAMQIRRYREEGLTFDQIAEKMGVSRVTLFRHLKLLKKFEPESEEG